MLLIPQPATIQFTLQTNKQLQLCMQLQSYQMRTHTDHRLSQRGQRTFIEMSWILSNVLSRSLLVVLQVSTNDHCLPFLGNTLELENPKNHKIFMF